MLDETTTYSCAIFARPDEPLADAQRRGPRRVCRACIQSILIPDHRWNRYRRSRDWIERYVFPGCLIPSLASLTGAAAAASRLTATGIQEIGVDYAETLRRWRATFLARLGDVRALGYDERFLRTWDFYLACCEAGFRTRALRNAQIVLER